LAVPALLIPVGWSKSSKVVVTDASGESVYPRSTRVMADRLAGTANCGLRMAPSAGSAFAPTFARKKPRTLGSAAARWSAEPSRLPNSFWWPRQPGESLSCHSVL